MMLVLNSVFKMNKQKSKYLLCVCVGGEGGGLQATFKTTNNQLACDMHVACMYVHCMTEICTLLNQLTHLKVHKHPKL